VLTATHEESWATPEIGRNGRDATDKTPALWPLLVCRSCGQPYIEGFDVKIAPTPIRNGSSKRIVLRLGKSGTAATDDVADDIAEIDLAMAP